MSSLTFLKWLDALEGDLEVVRIAEGRRVIENLHPKERDDRHGCGR